MADERADRDSPWKEAMDRFFYWFVWFFWPEIAVLIDWTKNHDPRDTQLRQHDPYGESGNMIADKLICVQLADSDDQRLFHAEIQGPTKRQDLPQRMKKYIMRIEDANDLCVWSILLLADENKDWRPNRYLFDEDSSRREICWKLVKLIDYAPRLEQLLTDENPFGSLVVAHLISQRTTQDADTRKAWKRTLLRALATREMESPDRREWAKYYDWMLPLPKEVEAKLALELEQDKGVVMPYVTSWERLGEERGQKAGFAEGKKAGIDEGKKAGIDEGKLAGLLEGIEALLDVRFPAESSTLLPSIRQCNDLVFLQNVLAALKRGVSLDELALLVG